LCAILNLQNPPANAHSYGTSVSAGDDDKKPAQGALDTSINPIFAGMAQHCSIDPGSSVFDAS
jgi:hypothetical protein